jgi:hypothetical protein
VSACSFPLELKILVVFQGENKSNNSKICRLKYKKCEKYSFFSKEKNSGLISTKACKVSVATDRSRAGMTEPQPRTP